MATWEKPLDIPALANGIFIQRHAIIQHARVSNAIPISAKSPRVGGIFLLLAQLAWLLFFLHHLGIEGMDHLEIQAQRKELEGEPEVRRTSDQSRLRGCYPELQFVIELNESSQAKSNMSPSLHRSFMAKYEAVWRHEP